jgi:hypothetical protein
MAFSKLKALLRKAAERTTPGLIRLIGRLLKNFSPKGRTNFLATPAMLVNEYDRNPL